MRRFLIQLLHHPHHLLELFHQVALVLQAAGGIGDQHVGAAGAGSLDGVIDDGGGVGTSVLGDHRNIVALTPHLQLLDRGGTEGIPRRQHHALAFGLELLGQLADGGGLADAVHADHQDHIGFLAGVDHQRLLDFRQHLAHVLLEQAIERLGILELLAVRVLHQALNDAAGGIHTKIGGQQLGLQLLEQLVIDLLATEQAEEAGADIFLGTHQAALEAGKEALPLRLVLSVVVHLGGQRQGCQRGGISLHLGHQTQIFRSLCLFGDTGFLGSLSLGGNASSFGSLCLGGNTSGFRNLSLGGNTSGFRSLCLGDNTSSFGSLCLGGNTSGFRSQGLGGNAGSFRSLRFGSNTSGFRSLSFSGNTGSFRSLCFGSNTSGFRSKGFSGDTGGFGGLRLGGNTGSFDSLCLGGDKRLIDDDGLEFGGRFLHHQRAFIRGRQGCLVQYSRGLGQGNISDGSRGNGGLGLGDSRGGVRGL